MTRCARRTVHRRGEPPERAPFTACGAGFQAAVPVEDETHSPTPVRGRGSDSSSPVTVRDFRVRKAEPVVVSDREHRELRPRPTEKRFAAG